MSVRNAQGEQVTQGTKQPDLPDAPTIGTITDVGTSRAYNNGAIDVAFTPAGYWDSTFTATSTPGSLTGTGSSSPIRVAGLSSATAYTFTVKSNNAAGKSGANSASSSSATATTVPQAPTIGAFTDGGTGTSGTLSFTAGNSGGKIITDYKYSTDNITYTSAGSTTSPLTVSGLSVGNYTFYLKAVNANGDSAASAGVAGTVIQPSNFESIATTTITTNTPSITFNSIPSTYTALQIRAISKTDLAGYNVPVFCRINGDTGATYSFHNITGDGTTAAAAAATGATTMTIGTAAASGSTVASNFGVMILDIYNYNSTTQTKVFRCFNGGNMNTGGGKVALTSGLWNSTSAITSLVFYNDSNFTAGTTFALYGIS